MSIDHGVWVTVYEPLLGSVVELRIRATDAGVADEADRRIAAEMRRLEHVFSDEDPASELCRWRRGELDGQTSADFDELLRMALHWQVAGGTPRYSFHDGVLQRDGDCSSVTFDAIVKGYIVDRAVATSTALDGLESIVVNAGGDLLHHGSGSIAVGIENPDTPYADAPPLTVVDISNSGLATSRTGTPVDHIRSASVIAPDAATADAVATIVSVLRAHEGVEFVDELEDISCCLVDAHGQVWASAGWARHERLP